MYRVVIQSLLTVFVSTQLWPASAAPDDQIEVDPSVSLVETFGLWDLQARHGRYRIVVTKGCSPEHCFDRAYLQWLETIAEPDSRYARTEVSRSVQIVELGDFVVVQSIVLVPTESQPYRFEIKATNTYTGEEGRLCVSPSSPGNYRVREGSCKTAA